MTNVVRWPLLLAEHEASFDTEEGELVAGLARINDPLGIDGAEYVARDPGALQIALRACMWLCIVGIVWALGALLAAVF